MKLRPAARRLLLLLALGLGAWDAQAAVGLARLPSDAPGGESGVGVGGSRRSRAARVGLSRAGAGGGGGRTRRNFRLPGWGGGPAKARAADPGKVGQKLVLKIGSGASGCKEGWERGGGAGTGRSLPSRLCGVPGSGKAGVEVGGGREEGWRDWEEGTGPGVPGS